MDLLTQFYGFYGYSVSPFGIVVGAFWGLIEGFVHFGIFEALQHAFGKIGASLRCSLSPQATANQPGQHLCPELESWSREK